MEESFQVTYAYPIADTTLWCCVNLACPTEIFHDVYGRCPTCKSETCWMIDHLRYKRRNVGM